MAVVAPAVKRPEDVRMTFGEHLEELRWRLFKSVLALLVGFAGAVYFYKPLVKFVVQPHFKAMSWLGLDATKAHLISGAYAGPIWAVMKLAFIVGFIAASPIMAYQIWRFVSAGLYSAERKYVVRFAPLSYLLFLGGCVFGYLILIPYGLYGMAMMLKVDVIDPTYTFTDYLNLVMSLTVVTGVMFELPLVMMFCTAIGLTTAKIWLKWMRFAVVAIFVAAAVLTPSPDIFTQVLMAVPLFLLYLAGIGLSAMVGRSPRIDNLRPST